MHFTPCPPGPSELGYLRWAARRARECHLYQEFVDGYWRYRTGGDSVEEVAWCALYDWDMLDP